MDYFNSGASRVPKKYSGQMGFVRGGGMKTARQKLSPPSQAIHAAMKKFRGTRG